MYIYIYLAASGCSCSMKAPELVGSVVPAHGSKHVGELISPPGIEPMYPVSGGKFLTT